MLTAAERGIPAFRNWFHRYSHGRVPFVSGTAPRRDPSPVGESNDIKRSNIIDRFEQHTEHCTSYERRNCANFVNLFRALALFAALTTVTIAATVHVLRWKASVSVALSVRALFAIQYIEDDILPPFVWREYDRAQ